MLVSVVSDEKSALDLIEDLFVWWVASLLLLSRFSFCCWLWHFDYVLMCGPLYVYPSWSLLSSLYVWIRDFHQIWEDFNHYFFNYFFLGSLYPLLLQLPLLFVVVYISMLDGVSHVSETAFFNIFFFLFLRLNNLNLSTIMFTNHLLCQMKSVELLFFS